jgi:putative hemolysin
MHSQFLILLGLIVLSALFSGSETALISISNSKVDELSSKKVKNARLLKRLKKDPHRLLITVLIGNNIVNITASGYAAIVFTDIFGSSGIGIATGIMTFFILIFGEITPKSFAHQHSVGYSLFVAKIIFLLQLLLFPVVFVLEKIVKLVNKISGSQNAFTVTEEELVAMLKIGAQEGSIESHERELIENVLEFNDINVEEVMTPRVAIEALDSEITIGEAVDFAIQHSHSRLPVYLNNLDNIIGIISIRDLLRYFDKYSPRKKLKSLTLQPPLEVPFSKKINNLFKEFQRKHVHIAIVIDEFGGTAGLVTMEDLLEEIVGDIVDEFDVHESPLTVVDSRNVVACGSTLIEDINDFFKIKFGRNERDTINTLVTEHLHRFPREGETIKFPRIRATVLKMNKNVIEKIKLTKTPRKKSS